MKPKAAVKPRLAAGVKRTAKAQTPTAKAAVQPHTRPALAGAPAADGNGGTTPAGLAARLRSSKRNAPDELAGTESELNGSHFKRPRQSVGASPAAAAPSWVELRALTAGSRSSKSSSKGKVTYGSRSSKSSSKSKVTYGSHNYRNKY